MSFELQPRKNEIPVLLSLAWPKTERNTWQHNLRNCAGYANYPKYVLREAAGFRGA
jgi:hypothetical protein